MSILSQSPLPLKKHPIADQLPSEGHLLCHINGPTACTCSNVQNALHIGSQRRHIQFSTQQHAEDVVIEVQAFDFTVVIGQHVNAFAIRVVATAIFVDVGENLGADGCGIVAITNRFRGGGKRLVYLFFLCYFFFFLFPFFPTFDRKREQEGE